MHPDSSRAWIHEKIGLQLYSHHARTEKKEDKALSFRRLSLSYSAVDLKKEDKVLVCCITKSSVHVSGCQADSAGPGARITRALDSAVRP